MAARPPCSSSPRPSTGAARRIFEATLTGDETLRSVGGQTTKFILDPPTDHDAYLLVELPRSVDIWQGKQLGEYGVESVSLEQRSVTDDGDEVLRFGAETPEMTYGFVVTFKDDFDPSA